MVLSRRILGVVRDRVGLLRAVGADETDEADVVVHPAVEVPVVADLVADLGVPRQVLRQDVVDVGERVAQDTDRVVGPLGVEEFAVPEAGEDVVRLKRSEDVRLVGFAAVVGHVVELEGLHAPLIHQRAGVRFAGMEVAEDDAEEVADLRREAAADALLHAPRDRVGAGGAVLEAVDGGHQREQVDHTAGLVNRVAVDGDRLAGLQVGDGDADVDAADL